MRDVGRVEPDERQVVVGAGVRVGLAVGLHRQPGVVDQRAGMRRARDLDLGAERQRCRQAAVGVGRGAGAGAVRRLADVGVATGCVDEVGRALAAGGHCLDPRMDGRGGGRRPGTCGAGHDRKGRERGDDGYEYPRVSRHTKRALPRFSGNQAPSCVDVEADVVEHERVAARRTTSAANGSRSSSGSASRCSRRQTVLANSSGSSSSIDARLEPAARSRRTPAARRRASVSSGDGEVVRAARSRAVLARRAPRRRPPSARPQEGRDVALAAALRDEPAARLERLVQAREQQRRGRRSSGRRRWRRPRRPVRRRTSSVRLAQSTVARSAGSAARACSTIEGAASTATTCPSGSRSSSIAVTRPEPQPASSTVSSPRSGSRSSTASAHATCGVETRS